MATILSFPHTAAASETDPPVLESGPSKQDLLERILELEQEVLDLQITVATQAVALTKQATNNALFGRIA